METATTSEPPQNDSADLEATFLNLYGTLAGWKLLVEAERFIKKKHNSTIPTDSARHYCRKYRNSNARRSEFTSENEFAPNNVIDTL